MANKYVIYQYFADNVGTVTAIYSGSYPDSLSGGLMISSEIPDHIDYPDLKPVLRIDLVNKELYYDYEKIQSIETDVEDLKEASETQNMDVASLIIQNAQLEVETTRLSEEQATLILELANKGVI